MEEKAKEVLTGEDCLSYEDWFKFYNIKPKTLSLINEAQSYLMLYFLKISNQSSRTISNDLVSDGEFVSHATINLGIGKGKAIFNELFPLMKKIDTMIEKEVEKANDLIDEGEGKGNREFQKALPEYKTKMFEVMNKYGLLPKSP